MKENVRVAYLRDLEFSRSPRFVKEWKEEEVAPQSEEGTDRSE